jgi:hypothetical protein
VSAASGGLRFLRGLEARKGSLVDDFDSFNYFRSLKIFVPAKQNSR